MTNQPKSTATFAAQKPVQKSQTLKIKLGDAKVWIPGSPCTSIID